MTGGWSLFCDIAITRRKRYHSVIDPSGSVVFRSRQVGHCMAYLDSIDVQEYLLTYQSDGPEPLPPMQVTRKEP